MKLNIFSNSNFVQNTKSNQNFLINNFCMVFVIKIDIKKIIISKNLIKVQLLNADNLFRCHYFFYLKQF